MRALRRRRSLAGLRVPVVAEVPLPDGSSGMVRVRRPPSVMALSAEALAARLAPAAAEFLADFVREPHGLTASAPSTGRGRVAARRGDAHGRSRSMPPWWVSTRAAALRCGFTTCGWSRATSASIRAGLPATAGLEVLDLDRLSIERLRVDEADLLAFVRAQKGLRHASLALGDGERARDGGTGRRPRGDGSRPLLARLRRRSLRARGGRRAAGRHAAPVLLAGWIVRHFDPTPQLSRLPMPVALRPRTHRARPPARSAVRRGRIDPLSGKEIPMAESLADRKRRAARILTRLGRIYPDARIELDRQQPARAPRRHHPLRPVHGRAREPGDGRSSSRSYRSAARLRARRPRRARARDPLDGVLQGQGRAP